MSTVECPICSNEVIGEGPDVLSENLRKHFIEVHKNRVIEEVAHLKPVREGEGKEVEEVAHLKPVREGPASKEIEEVRELKPVRETEGKEVEEVAHLRPVRETEGKEVEEVAHLRSMPEGGRSPESERIVEEVAHFKEKPAPPKAPSMTGATGKAMVNCPVCGKTVVGDNDGDLSKALREHVGSSHKL